MKHLKKNALILLVLLTTISGSRTFAQEFFSFAKILNLERAKDVMHDNEYGITGHEQGTFFSNPLMLNGKPLDYNQFSLQSNGELTVIKGAAITGQPTQVAFYVYLRRSGKQVTIPGKEKPDPLQLKIELSEVLKYAEPGDQLVIESVRKEDGSVKRILNLLNGGC